MIARLPVIAAAVAAGLLPLSPGVAADWQVAAWAGNTPEWNRDLGVTELRQGCSSAPETCIRAVRSDVAQERVGCVMLAITDDPAHIADYAAQYAVASRTEPHLCGVGVDDFVGVLRTWPRAPGDPGAPVALLSAVVDSAKGNPTLEFGVTIYEDELSSRLLTDLPADLRARIDRVYLYLHYRAGVKQYAQHVRETRQLFAKARLFGGIYAYDRIDYAPCSARRSPSCTPEQEMGLFRELLNVQMSMLRTGALDGIEFYPGNFGAEQQWNGWSRPGICKASRRDACVKLTLDMRKAALAAVQRARGIGKAD
jgi:hypothetical protein